MIQLNEKISCVCGCGKLKNKYDKNGIIRKCIKGHWARAKKKWSGEDNPKWKGEIKEKFCLICGNKLKRKRILHGSRFCSRKCVSIWSKTKTGKNSCGWKGGKITKSCDYCGKKITRHPVFFSKHCFCNFICYGSWLKISNNGKKNPNWRGGKSFEPYDYKFNKKLREEIKKRDNYTCQFPNCNQKQNGKAFCVHHIDYGKDNSNPINLITLCNSHNSKVNGNRKHWEEYFQNKLEERGIRQ